jgi:hypothetical protein
MSVAVRDLAASVLPAEPVRLLTRWGEGVHGFPGIHVLANAYHLAIPYFPDDGRWHVEGTSVALDGALVVQLGDRYASARVHLFDVERKERWLPTSG